MFEPLDAEEAEIMASRERGEWVSMAPEELKRTKKKLQEMARNTLKKSERATIRLAKADLEGIKMMAAKEGIGYQTLISSLIHKYVTGQIETS
ncbi:MAG: hypothetical protein A2527_13360 [Candidatus Lambdaproteobacteria bacterium RIFOXYD2_FULL_50_16]|uniref:Antitoxin n=1 Tax=Candidatus Lambdaproteobacteria bacterium RIFOXYD2_FULL_50_16 TaxID=1817772 RepID=A0A1F6G5D1_9PROT|nr:MAG: hypothetical protein A2527_13360 [Candidatus Lambdaproteobacteria bacterium RIFOXYD2_FULL_50_16]